MKYGIERTYDGGFTWQTIPMEFRTWASAEDYMMARGWDRLAEQTFGEEGARVVIL